MALDDYKIVDADYTGKDVSGLADKPTLTAAQLKARFDSLVKNVVAVKYNACIDALKTLIAGLASKVTGATNGNFAALDADGQLTDSLKKPADFADRVTGATNGNFAGLNASGNLVDSGKKETDFEPISIARHTVYKDSIGAGWYKILSFPAVGAPVVSVEGFSCAAFHYQHGHWKLVINCDWEYYIRADLIYASNGITPDSFDVRLDGDTIKLYFYMPHYTPYRILTETFEGSVSVTTFDTEETPSGTAVTVVAARREESVAITLSSIVFQYEVEVSWATPSMWFQAIRTDEIMGYGTHPIRAYCETSGYVKVYLNMYPDAAQNGTTMNVKISGWL